MTAQDKSDYTWLLGYNPNDSTGGFGGALIRFTTSGITLQYFDIPIDLGISAQICDQNGNNLFYSNGCKIINMSHQLMQGGDDINPGEMHDYWCNTGDEHDYNTHQGLIALPWPGRKDQYIMFHMGWYRRPVWPKYEYLRDFYFTHIDMAATGGLGEVVDKNHLLLQDTNLVDNLTAVRHGNGRDWWVVLPRGRSDTIYTFLVTPQGIQGPLVQETGVQSKVWSGTGGQIVFTPDGSRFIRVNETDGIDIFSFDRCTGLFSCPQQLPFPDPGIYYQASGAAVSSNSRFLYISPRTQLYQYDLWAPDIEQSKILLGEYDGFKSGQLSTTFYQQMLAPDGKIYMTATNGVRYLHVIHHPDSAGLSCDFRQHDLKLPTHHGFCVPNFPHFRLYDAPGSPCDTLGIDAPEGSVVPWVPSAGIALRPNPASEAVSVAFPICNGGRLQVHSIAGLQMETRLVTQQVEHVIDCSAWPAGVYVVSFTPAGACKPFSAKLVVAR